MLYDQLGRGQIMDAAQKLLRIAALLCVISMLMAAPGWAAPPPTLVVSPTTLTIGNSGNDFVSVNMSDASAVSFTATPSQTWVKVAGTLTTPTQLQFTLYPTQAPGSTATVTLHPRSEEHTSELQSFRHLVCR